MMNTTTIIGLLLLTLGLLFKPLYSVLRGILGLSTTTESRHPTNAPEGRTQRYTDPDEPKDNLHEIQRKVNEGSTLNSDDLGSWLDQYFDRDGSNKK